MNPAFNFLERPCVKEDVNRVRDRILSAHEQKNLAILGSSLLPQKCAHALEAVGGQVPFLIDYDARYWGKSAGKWPIISMSEAHMVLKSDALLISAVWSPNHVFAQTKSWAQRYGYEDVLPVHALFWALPDHLEPHYQLAPPHIFFNSRAEIEAVDTLFADDVSRREFRAHVEWRVTLNEAILPIWDQSRVYFGVDFYSLPEAARIADVGAFDGDSLRTYLYWRGDSFGQYDAFEPDPQSYARLVDYIDLLPENVANRITPSMLALGHFMGNLQLHGSGMRGSKTGKGDALTGQRNVSVCTLDQIYADQRVDFIKLDIEGSELDALMGAQQIIQRDRPLIAVAIYHKPHDIFSIPTWLAKRTTNYRYFLRSHDADGIDLVFYAVPNERCSA